MASGVEVSRSGGASLDWEISSKRGLFLLLRNSVETSKLVVVVLLGNALTLLDLRIGALWLLLLEEDLAEEEEEGVFEEDWFWFPLREEDLKAATAITTRGK